MEQGGYVKGGVVVVLGYRDGVMGWGRWSNTIEIICNYRNYVKFWKYVYF